MLYSKKNRRQITGSKEGRKIVSYKIQRVHLDHLVAPRQDRIIWSLRRKLTNEKPYSELKLIRRKDPCYDSCMTTLVWLVLGIYALMVCILIFWQISNLVSLWLGAPPVSSPHEDYWLPFANTKKTFLDLGCGNGTVCLRAAPYFKHVYGIEGSPFYYWLSRLRTRHCNNVTILYSNFLKKEWPKTDIIYCYLYPEILTKLVPRFKDYDGLVLSLAFPIESWQPTQELKKKGRTLYIYQPPFPPSQT